MNVEQYQKDLNDLVKEFIAHPEYLDGRRELMTKELAHKYRVNATTARKDVAAVLDTLLPKDATSADGVPIPDDIQRYIDQYAHVTQGGVSIYIDKTDPCGHNGRIDEQNLIKRHADHEHVFINDKGDTKHIPHAKDFVEKYRAETDYYPNGTVFDPREGAIHDGMFNTFRGFKVEPNENGSCELFKELVRDVWCGANEEVNEWVWEDLLHTVAHPGEKLGTALAIHGNYGHGKSMPFEHFLYDIFGGMLRTVTDEQQVLGQFNDVLDGALIIVMEEAAFAGNLKAFEKAKQVITGKRVRINRKYVPAYEVDNYTRLVIVSNLDHFIHIKPGDRRYTVLKTDGEAAKKWKESGKYAAALKQWKEGGAARFVFEAKNHQFRKNADGTLVISTNMKTEAMREQISQSRNALEQVIAAFLTRGTLYGETQMLGTQATQTVADTPKIAWDLLKPFDYPSSDLQKIVKAETAKIDKAAASHQTSYRAIHAALERMGVKVASVPFGKARTMKMVFPDRFTALMAAFEAGAITKAEFLIGTGGYETADELEADIEKERAAELQGSNVFRLPTAANVIDGSVAPEGLPLN